MNPRQHKTYEINGKTYHVKNDPYDYPEFSFQETVDGYETRRRLRRMRLELTRWAEKVSVLARRFHSLFNLRDRLTTPERALCAFQAFNTDIIVGRAYVKVADCESGAWYMTI